ncbi:MAG TPA: ABC transporter substrate-binding protein, partial [Thermoanaerobaculia bacterium]|nr:ABC transporter substrate-binding protein [Thermoanaerobaculia bacterium]
FAPLLTGFATASMRIVSPAAVRQHARGWLAREASGTGPFRLVQWAPDGRIVLAANESYWRGRPLLDRVVFRVVSNVDTAAKLLGAGEVQVVDGLDAAAREQLRGGNVEVRREPALATSYLALNTARPPFDDRRVRQAVGLAVDLNDWVRATYMGFGIPARNYLPPKLWGYDNEIEPWEPDLPRARKLLAEAGLPGGFRFTLDVMNNSRPYMPEPLRVAARIKETLAKVGIHVDLRVNSWSEHIQRTVRSSAGDYQACLLGWGADMPDPNDFLYVMFHSHNADLSRPHQNMALYRNPEVDRLLELAQRTGNREERTALYRRVQEIVRADVPLVPIAHTFVIVAHDPRVRDLSVPLWAGEFGLEKVWLAPPQPAGRR